MPESTHLLRGSIHTYNVYDSYYVDTLDFERYGVIVLWGGYARAACATRITPPHSFRGYSDELRVEVGMSMLERPTPPDPSAFAVTPSDVGWAKCHPCLSAYLHQTRYADGSPRERSTLTLFADDGGGWRAVLNDREESRSLWATGPDLSSLWLALESQLGSGAARWRYDAKSGAKRGRGGR